MDSLDALMSSDWKFRPLAWPARFERATWALDEIIPRAQSLLLADSSPSQPLLKVTLKKIPTLELVS